MFKPVPHEEVYRKLLHLLVIILPLGVFYGPSIFDLNRLSIAAVSLALLLFSILIEVLRLRNLSFGRWFYSSFGSMLRKEEKKQLTGATYVAGATFLCAFLGVYNEALAACAFLALTLFVLGDAVAALVGKSLGRLAIGKKTLEGAIACFVLCTIVGYTIFPLLPCFLVQWGGEVTFVQAILIGLSVAILELFPIKFGEFSLNDNLYVPVLVSFVAFFIR